MERPQIERATAEIGDLAWMCTAMVFYWRASEAEANASELFADAFGCDATRSHRKKFPTAGMPCRSWARGVSDGVAIDISIGVNDDYSQMRLQRETEGEPLLSDLARFQLLVRKLEDTSSIPLAGCRAALYLEMPDEADHADFIKWLNQSDWQMNASLLKQEYVFASSGCNLEISIAAEFDRRCNRAELAIGLNYGAPSGMPAPEDYFGVFRRLLAMENIADIVSM